MLLEMVTTCLTYPFFLLSLESSASVAEIVLLVIVEGLEHPALGLAHGLFVLSWLALASLTPSTLTFRITSLLQMPMMCWPALEAEPMF